MDQSKRWPFIISNPHCGSLVPASLRAQTLLTPQQIVKDSDEQAMAIYSPLQSLCQCYFEATIARAFVDLNRRADDFSKDGVVKTHTCWNEPVYHQPLTSAQIRSLIKQYYDIYHARLLDAVTSKRFDWLFDCHTMAQYPPPVAPDNNSRRPLVCLGNGNGEGCSAILFDKVMAIFNEVFDGQVSRNLPFSGGYICRHYGQHLPAVQIELSRTLEMNVTDKSNRIQLALEQISQL